MTPVAGPETRRFGVFWGLLLALGSRPFYRDVARHWPGIGVRYLLLLLTVTWIPVLVDTQAGFNRLVDDRFGWRVALPDMKISRGRLSSPVAQPFDVSDRTGKIHFVLDTTGKVNTLDDTTADVLATETRLYVRQPPSVTNIRELPDVDLPRDRILGWVGFAKTWSAVVLFPIVLAVSLVAALVLTFVVSIWGVLLRSLLKLTVPYGAIFRMAAVGLTLPAYAAAAAILLDVAVPLRAAIVMAIAVPTAYVLFGMLATKDRPEPQENEAFLQALREFRRDDH